MAEKKRGNQTVKFEKCPYVIGAAAVVGQKEGQGPLSSSFDVILEEDMFGEKTWEKAESKMLKEAMLTKIGKGEEGYRSGTERRSAQSTHVLFFHGERSSSPLSGTVRSLLDDDRIAAAWRHAHRRGICPQYHRRRVQPLLYSRKAVPNAC